jgi:hypothetical protein
MTERPEVQASPLAAEHHLFDQQRPLHRESALHPPGGSTAEKLRGYFDAARHTVSMMTLEGSLGFAPAGNAREALDAGYTAACARPYDTTDSQQALRNSLLYVMKGDLTSVGGASLCGMPGTESGGLPQLAAAVQRARRHILMTFDGDSRGPQLTEALDSWERDAVTLRTISAYRTLGALCIRVLRHNDFRGLGGPNLEAEDLQRRAELDTISQRVSELRATLDGEVGELESRISRVQTKVGATTADKQTRRRARGIRVRARDEVNE